MNDFVSILLTIISLVIGIIGAIFTYRAYSRERALKSISWSDIQNGTKYIWKGLRNLGFTPDIMISPDPKGGIIAYQLSQFYDEDIFIDVGQAKRKNSTTPHISSKNYHTVICTNRWEVFLSKEIEDIIDKEQKKVLIVDDFVLSGDFNSYLFDFLEKMGYKKENIKICCLAVTKVAISSDKAPDFYWKIVDDEDFYFPWGKAE